MVVPFSGVSCDQPLTCELRPERARKHPSPSPPHPAVPTEASVQAEAAALIPSPRGTPARTCAGKGAAGGAGAACSRNRGFASGATRRATKPSGRPPVRGPVSSWAPYHRALCPASTSKLCKLPAPASLPSPSGPASHCSPAQTCVGPGKSVSVPACLSLAGHRAPGVHSHPTPPRSGWGATGSPPAAGGSGNGHNDLGKLALGICYN